MPVVSPLEARTQGEKHLAYWWERLGLTSFVYVLRSAPATPIKVGVTNDVVDRIACLQTGNPYRLRLLHVVPGDQHLERCLHRRLRWARVHGEWFDGPAVTRFLAEFNVMAELMIAAHDGSGRPPRYQDFGDFPSPRGTFVRRPTLSPERAALLPQPPGMTVRFVEPSPKTDPVEARRWRESMQGCTAGMYAPARMFPATRFT